MPNPMAICIEDLDPQSGAPQYVRCVAIPGRAPGLRLDLAGQVLWQSDEGVVCELWVSADERLIMYRPEGAVAVTLRRAGRSLDVPCGKPVVVIDQDEVEVGPRRLRLHVHGEAPSVAAPAVVVPEQGALGRLARAAAAAVVIASTAAGGGCELRERAPKVAPEPQEQKEIEVRRHPPVVVRDPRDAKPPEAPAGSPKGDKQP